MEERKKAYFYRIEGQWKEKKLAFLQEKSLPIMEVSAPEEFGGISGMWTPEHLFVASVVACFIMTFISVAAAMRVEFEEFRCEGEGRLEPVEGNKMAFVEVTLKPAVTVRSEILKEKVLKALKVTHDHCLVARSLKSDVRIEPSIIVK